MNCRTILSIAIAGLTLGLTLNGCSPPQTKEQPAGNSASPSTTPSTAKTAAKSTDATPSSSPPPASNPASENSPKQSTNQPPNLPSASISAPALAVSKAPLTVEKLKNAEYYFLAQGPIKLTNGRYEDSTTQKTVVLDDLMTYGDLNHDGIKDAVGSLKVTIPNSGEFSYLVTVLNQNGNPKNIAAEFLGPQVKVKSITIKPDSSIEVAMQEYRPGDPACCPSLGLSRIYKLRTNQPTPKTAPQK